jgi:glycosyltransferase involved in cell wall biosynthesis
MYMAAGTPVVACNIPGFQFIKEAGAGILIDNYQPATILKAIREIESNYKLYSDACLRIAEESSFDKNVAPYIAFLKTQ